MQKWGEGEKGGEEQDNCFFQELTLRIGTFSWLAWNTARLQRPATLDKAVQVAELLSKEAPESRGRVWSTKITYKFNTLEE